MQQGQLQIHASVREVPPSQQSPSTTMPMPEAILMRTYDEQRCLCGREFRKQDSDDTHHIHVLYAVVEHCQKIKEQTYKEKSETEVIGHVLLEFML